MKPAITTATAQRDTEKSFRLQPWQLSLLIGLLALATYLPTAKNQFVNYDDPDYITSNAHVQQGLTWGNLKWAFTTGHASNWHPLTWLSHMLDWQLFGDKAGAHHLVSAGFHALNSSLVFLFLLLATQAKWRSAAVAALFAVHPLHVESVAWASERKDVLSALFGLLTLIAYTKYAHAKDVDRASRSSRESRSWANPWFWYGLAVVALALGLLSKPMLVTWPFVLLLFDFWPFHRMRFLAEPQPTSTKKVAEKDKNLKISRWSFLLIEKIPFFALSIASSIITYKVQRHGGAVSFTLTTYERLANA
jgi:hypothetical protein